MFTDNIIEILKLLDENAMPELDAEEKEILDSRDSSLFRLTIIIYILILCCGFKFSYTTHSALLQIHVLNDFRF